MKQHNICSKSPKRRQWRSDKPITIGVDLGDKSSQYCAIDDSGELIDEGRLATTRNAFTKRFGELPRCRIAIEVGTHSRWVSQLLANLGHEVIVANARQVKLISHSSRKDDRLDAEMLARLARADLELLRPIQHRGEQAQQHLMVIRVRAALVEARTRLVNAARGLTKATGERLPGCGAEHLGPRQAAALPAACRQTLELLLAEVESLTQQIRECDRRIEQIARNEYPETALLRQVSGVGTLIALTFVLTLEDRRRFGRSRDVGCYIGLRPRWSRSGERDPQLRISKEGDPYLRTLLVQGAHYILGWRGPDTDLRRWGLRLAERGGKNAKKRAVVAVARKLAVLLHSLWRSGEVYEPLRHSRARERGVQAA